MEKFFYGKSKKIIVNLSFSEKEFDKIKRGHVPTEMEDKWFIYYENNWLFFHRSWTGLGVYRAEVFKCNNEYCIKEFFVEEKLSNTDESEDVSTFIQLIKCYRLLQKGEY